MSIDPSLASLSRTINADVLGGRIKAARIAAGLRQSELADGISSKTYVSRIESGARRPDLALLVRFTERLGVSLQELLTGSSAVERAELRLRLDHAELELRSGGAPRALALVTEVIDRLEGAHLSDLAAEAAYVRALALEGTGDANGAILALEDLLAATRSDSGGRVDLKAAIALTRCYRESGDLGRAIRTGDEALGRLAALDLEGGVEAVQLAVTVASAHFENGDVQYAVRLCRRAIERAEGLDSPLAKASAYWNASIMESEQGNVNAAIPLAQHALSLLDAADDNRSLAVLHSQLGKYLLKADPPDPATAIEVLTAAEREMAGSGATRSERANNTVTMARAHLMGGDPDRALRLLDTVRDEGDHGHMLNADLHLLTGQVHAAAGMWDEARLAYLTAVRDLTAVGADRRAAQLWFELGSMLQAAGDIEAAGDAYRRAAVSTGLSVPRSTAMVTD